MRPLSKDGLQFFNVPCRSLDCNGYSNFLWCHKSQPWITLGTSGHLLYDLKQWTRQNPDVRRTEEGPLEDGHQQRSAFLRLQAQGQNNHRHWRCKTGCRRSQGESSAFTLSPFFFWAATQVGHASCPADPSVLFIPSGMATWTAAEAGNASLMTPTWPERFWRASVRPSTLIFATTDEVCCNYGPREINSVKFHFLVTSW